ncbi:MAG TPA: acyl-CoA dehydrogenase family protein [Pseudonocardiaceae bacterium]|jgi:alkylation response protein AidB-like acyl-CoA dehydrogenase|nr:acyl-CoA dehydrogenase family protein [Pseudonocardiaceae bacterium]
MTTTTPSAASRAANLLYTDVEEALRSSVADLLAKRSGPVTVLANLESGPQYDTDLWCTLAEQLDVAGLLIPETLGGVGGSARETAVIAEELGKAVAPVPFLGSAVLATSALLACDTSADTVRTLLAALASGERTAALAVPLSTMPGAAFPDSVTADGPGALTGTAGTVVDALAADVFVVPATGPDGPALYAVRAGDGVTVTPLIALDRTRGIADVTFDGAAGEVLPGSAEAALAAALTAGAAVLAAEQLGIAEWCLDTTVRYVKERYQFGRPVGSFQALKHRLADVYQELVTARAAARYAADCVSADRDDVAVAVSVAQAHCSLVAVHAAEESIQLHGGIGMTWEHPAHLFLKRAKSDEIALGTPGRHRQRLAGLVELPGPVA